MKTVAKGLIAVSVGALIGYVACIAKDVYDGIKSAG